MKEKFRNTKLDGPILINMDDAKGLWTGDKAQIVAHIIQICETYRRNGDTLSLRQLYYQLVAKDLIPNHDKVYNKIGSIKDDIVYAGLVDWDTFEDRGRVPITAYYEEGIAEAFERTRDFYKLDRQLDQPNHIEVWTEKDAISGILSKVTLPFTIRLVINKGYTSSSAIYEAYGRFIDAMAAGQKIKILYFGDHDPSGLDMIRDIRDRLIYMFLNGSQMYSELEDRIEKWWNSSGLNIYDVAQLEGYQRVEKLADDDDEKASDLFDKGKIQLFLAYNDLFEVIPIGLTMEQIKQYRPPHNPTKITDPRAKGYVKEFGGTSWEVDSLTPEIMRNIVREKIEGYMDLKIYEDLLEKEQEHKTKITEIIDSLDTDE